MKQSNPTLKEFAKNYPHVVDKNLQYNIIELIKPILEELKKSDIFKVTVPLSITPIHYFVTNVDSDFDKNIHRSIISSVDFGIEKYPVRMHLTQVSNIESVIPVVEIQDNPASQALVQMICERLLASIPPHLEVSSKAMSLYIIASYGMTGPLWKIHKDNCEVRAHWVITPCNEKFVWYGDEGGKQVISEIQFLPNELYLMSVSDYHTAVVDSYEPEVPRIHVVADLRHKDA